MIRSAEQERIHGLFHQAWGQAKDSPSYDKEVWKKLDAVICEITRPRTVAKPPMTKEEMWRGFPLGHWISLMAAIKRDEDPPAQDVEAIENWRNEKLRREAAGE
jgi:hypothetical protein